jgi:glycosyltransferase involved in cell wall biosynthesis
MDAGLLIYGSLQTISGGYLYDRKLVEHLRRQGDRVEIISLPWRNYARHLGDNFSSQTLQRLEGLKLDVLLQDELNHPSLFWLNRKLRRRVKIPILSIVHHLRSSELRPAWQNFVYRQVERLYLASLDGFIFNSQTTRQAVEALVGARRPALVAYPAGDRLQPAIDVERVAQRARQPGALRLIFLGNLIARKGLHTLLQALTRLQADTWQLNVVGRMDVDGGYAARMIRLAQHPALRQGVRFLGPLDDTHLAAAFQESHVLVTPSSYEGFGIVYLEAMGFGLPAIGSLAGAATEVITSGENGYLIQPEDAAGLAEILQHLAADRERLAQMGAAALQRYAAHPTWEETCTGIRRFLCQLV